MAQASKTFAGSTLTPSGDAAVSGNVLTVAAAASYSDDFESYSIGATPTGMTTVSTTATVQSSSGQKVMRVVAASWGGVYYTGATFGDGCFVATALAVGGRMNPAARYSSSAARGYPLQMLASFIQLGNSLPTNFVSLNSPLRVQQDGVTMPSLPWTSKLQTFTEGGGNVQVRCWLNDVLRFDYLDSINKWVAGSLAAELFAGTTDYSAWAFYPVKTGGFTKTLTPTSVTSLTRIVIEWDNENSVAKRTSEVFEYQIDGGSWTAVPDSGYINAACTSTIGIRANSTLKNGYDSTGAVTVNSIAVEIDGQWDAVSGGPGQPTLLQATALGATQIRLNWSDGADTLAQLVYQSSDSNFANASRIGLAYAGSNTFTATGLSPSTAYWFWVEPVNAVTTGTKSSSATATTTATPILNLAHSADDLAYDLVKWLVAEALATGSVANFVNGEISSSEQQSGKIHLFAAFVDDLPSDCGVVTASNITNELEFTPLRNARIKVLLRTTDDDTSSARVRAEAAAKALIEFTRDENMQDKTHVTLPSGRRVLIFKEQQSSPGGMDASGRYQVLVEFRMQYLDTITQSN